MNFHKAPKGFKFVNTYSFTNGKQIGVAIKCKECGHQTTEGHETHKKAIKEHNKRGHSAHLCKWFKENNE